MSVVSRECDVSIVVVCKEGDVGIAVVSKFWCHCYGSG